MNNPITIQITVHTSLSTVWESWNKPEHIIHWAFASDTWEAPAATNDLRVGGRFVTTMAAKDKSASFDFSGTYTTIEQYKHIAYDLDDKRHVEVLFEEVSEGIHITVSFEPEQQNSQEMQQQGWQAILDNFRNYTEAQ
jgi:uncharacterized protein YndB with AHSA1/START domain